MKQIHRRDAEAAEKILKALNPLVFSKATIFSARSASRR